MRRIGLALSLLTALLPLPAVAATITVQPGQTLSDIAADYGVSVGYLMRMNGIRNSDFVEAGSRLSVPGPEIHAGPGRHRVQSGESLSTIAGRYRVSSRDLMIVNGLRNPNHVEVGQTLKLPSHAVIAKAKPKAAPINVVPGASQHTVGRGQTLTQIARAYQLPVATLIDLNAINDPNKVKVGTTLYLKAPNQPLSESSLSSTPVQQPVVRQQPVVKQTPVKTAVVAKGADWRTYGPLQVDWANWQPMGGSQVVPTLNAEGQSLYLAVNCEARKINVTGADGGWKTWASPASGFEKDLVKDRCQATG